MVESKKKSNLFLYIFIASTIVLLGVVVFLGISYQNNVNAINQKDTEIVELNSQLSQKDTETTNLNNQLSTKDSKLQKIKVFEEYQVDYWEDIEKINDIIYDFEIDKDYTTCIAYKNKYAELHQEFNENEKEKLAFLNSISTESETCKNNIKAYSELIDKVDKDRDDWRTKLEKWCYGYHKVDWSDSWTEEYATPWENAGTTLSDSEDKIGDAFNQAKVSCII
ncbi:MAG: hypothetical protein H6502_05225 [Candidatus Woesearchaeota archaeon]|nr:MAG: hypothetical protein H6502_05225 [Candidatus Woesearchaeota archaeon]